mmetsp:Transcript_52307/g.86909  ORF Transcript_52307/g.86909 Transcript_52307/m.86909 type:complete len:374 (-) Transcript_52307:905-2026(-)
MYIFCCPAVKTKAISFEKYFKAEDGAKVFVQSSEARELLRTALETAAGAGPLNSMEKYLPLIRSMFESVELPSPDNGLVEAINVHPPAFAWTSPVVKKSTAFFSMASYKYEYLMALQVYGYLHLRAASQALQGLYPTDGSFEESAKIAGNHLRVAAGVFDYVNSTESLRFLNLPYDRHPELLPQLPAALSCIALAEAQKIACAKASSKNASHQLCAKLCRGVASTFEDASKFLLSLTSDYNDFSPSLRTYVIDMHTFYEALAHMHLGLEAKEAENHGLAVSYMQAALSQAQKTSFEYCTSPELHKEIEQQKHALKALKERFMHENDHIYFEKVVAPQSLPAPPEPKRMFSAIPFFPPDRTFSIHQITTCVVLD